MHFEKYCVHYVFFKLINIQQKKNSYLRNPLQQRRIQKLCTRKQWVSTNRIWSALGNKHVLKGWKDSKDCVNILAISSKSSFLVYKVGYTPRFSMHIELRLLTYGSTTGCTTGVDDRDLAFMMGASWGWKRLDSPDQVGSKTIFINRLANLVRRDLNQGDDNQQSSEEVVDQVW